MIDTSNVKIVLYGPKEAGKTSILERTLNKADPSDLANLPPTILIDIRNYQHKKYNCSIFDCGGQLKFFEKYNDEMEDQVFANADVFLYVVDARLYFEDDVKDWMYEGKSKEEAVKLSRKRYTKVAKREFWQALKNLSTYSRDTLALIGLLVHKYELEDAIPHEIVQNIIQSAPSDDIIPNSAEIFNQVKNFLAEVRAFDTSVHDISEESKMSSAETVIFTILDSFSELKEQKIHETEKYSKQEISKHLSKLNSETGAYGSFLVNVETRATVASVLNPNLPTCFFFINEQVNITPFVVNIWENSQNLLETVGDKKGSELIFMVGPQSYLTVYRVTEKVNMVVVIPRNVDNLEKIFTTAQATSQQLQSVLAAPTS